MDKNKVKFTLHSMEDDICIIIDKFLDNDYFNARDLYWWWNPNAHWTNNKKYADKAIRILTVEGCIVRIDKGICQSYKKTSEFVDLLLEIRRIEEILEGL